LCGSFSAVTIDTAAQVSVNTDVSLAIPLTLGAQAVAGTELILQGAKRLTVTGLTWVNGHISLNGSSAKLSVGSLGISASSNANADRQITGGGNLSLEGIASGGLDVAGGSVVVNGAGISASGSSKSITVASGAWVKFDGNSRVNNAITFDGNGNFTIANTGNLWADAAISLAADTYNWGNLTFTASGSATVETSTKLVVAAGARVQRTAAATATALTVASGATLEFAAGASASVISNANLALQGTLNVAAGAKAQVVATGTWTVTGGGSVVVAASGSLEVSAAASAQAALDVAGELKIAAGKAVSVTSATFRNTSKFVVNFAGSTFSRVDVSGAFKAEGSLEVNLGSEPTSAVVLVKAVGGVTGTFSATVNVGASAGRRLLGNGAVTYTDTTVEYHPGSGNSASSVSLGLAAFIAPIALLW
jgi:hypothetical protein